MLVIAMALISDEYPRACSGVRCLTDFASFGHEPEGHKVLGGIAYYKTHPTT